MSQNETGPVDPAKSTEEVVTPTTETGEDPKPAEKTEEKTPATVPASVMMEEKTKRKNAEAELAVFKQKEAEALEAKKIADGKHEEVITDLRSQISEKDATIATLTESDNTLKAMAKYQLTKFKEEIGADKFDEVIAVTGINAEEPASDVLGKMAGLRSLAGAGAPTKPTGGRTVTQTPSGMSERAAELKKKAIDGTITHAERTEMMKMASGK